MKKLVLLTTALIFSLVSFSQITRQNEQFEDIPVINKKVAFVKEVKTQTLSAEHGYELLKEWAKENYGKDPFVSSVRYDARKSEIVAKSRVELILPENAAGKRETVVMRFRINGFVFEDKCILEISDLSYLHENAKGKKLPKVIRAEDFITDEKIAEDDAWQELKVNTRKSTLYFLNNLAKGFEERVGY